MQKLELLLFKYLSSWIFIIQCSCMIGLWVLYANTLDPYPYILLNLVLSCIAALSTPIVLRGQAQMENSKLQEILDKLKEEKDK